MDPRNDNSRADKDQIYAFADRQGHSENPDHSMDERNLSPDSGGGLALPEDRIEANLHDSGSDPDWDRQQNMRGTGRMEEDNYPEF